MDADWWTRVEDALLGVEAAQAHLRAVLAECGAPVTPAAVAAALDGQVVSSKVDLAAMDAKPEKPTLDWYPDKADIDAVRERWGNEITDDLLHEVTASFIRWHRDKGQEPHYAGSSRRWTHWVAKRAQRNIADALAREGIVAKSEIHARESVHEADDVAQQVRERGQG